MPTGRFTLRFLRCSALATLAGCATTENLPPVPPPVPPPYAARMDSPRPAAVARPPISPLPPAPAERFNQSRSAVDEAPPAAAVPVEPPLTTAPLVDPPPANAVEPPGPAAVAPATTTSTIERVRAMQARAAALAELEATLARDQAAVDAEAANLRRVDPAAPASAASSSHVVNLRDADQKRAGELLLEWAMNLNEVDALAFEVDRAAARHADPQTTADLSTALAARRRRVTIAVESLAKIDPALRRSIAETLSKEATLPAKLRERLTRWGARD